MRRLSLRTLLLCAFFHAALFAQGDPIVVSVASLSQNPREFDGRLVSVRASLVFGWEGDNFLFNTTDLSPGKPPPHDKPSVWFYCKPENERFVYNAIRGFPQTVQGTFIGYFHYVPNKKGRVKSVFDPGPFQLETIAVLDAINR